MSKIEQQMVAAVQAASGWKSGNTEVYVGARDCMVVALHGKVIAQVDPSGGIPMSFTLAGWNTTTTRSRINALLEAFGKPFSRVSTRDGQALFAEGAVADEPRVTRRIDDSEWVQA